MKSIKLHKVNYIVHVSVARVFRIWGDLEIAHGHLNVSGFWAISRWAKGVFRILKRPSPSQDLEIATFLRLKPLLMIAYNYMMYIMAATFVWLGWLVTRRVATKRCRLGLQLLLATNRKPYHGNPTVPFWSPTVAPSWCTHPPHCLNFVHISKIAFIIIILIIFCNFFGLIIVIGLVVLFIN